MYMQGLKDGPANVPYRKQRVFNCVAAAIFFICALSPVWHALIYLHTSATHIHTHKTARCMNSLCKFISSKIQMHSLVAIIRRAHNQPPNRTSNVCEYLINVSMQIFLHQLLRKAASYMCVEVWGKWSRGRERESKRDPVELELYTAPICCSQSLSLFACRYMNKL